MRNLTILPALVVMAISIAASTSDRPTAQQSSPRSGQRSTADAATIVPFKTRVADDVLRDLRARLAQTRFPDELEGAGWDYGTNLAYLKELVTYWRTAFDWRAQERRLNQFDQFKTNIDGLDIHFIHQRSKEPHALPLVLTHGWPGSFVEFTKVIGPLTDPMKYGGRAEDAFDVVAATARFRRRSPRRWATP
jgi:hypothetical protein